MRNDGSITLRKMGIDTVTGWSGPSTNICPKYLLISCKTKKQQIPENKSWKTQIRPKLLRLKLENKVGHSNLYIINAQQEIVLQTKYLVCSFPVELGGWEVIS